MEKTKESDTIFDLLDRSRIAKYHVDYDLTDIEDLLRSDGALSPTMRNFIADILTGKIKRKKPSTLARDFEIYCQIHELLENGYKLTSSTSNPCAISIVSEKLGIEEDAVAKAYQRIDREIKEDASNR
ncbi:MAG: hypothetical protein ACXW00_09640 [Methylobacter sp.]